MLSPATRILHRCTSPLQPPATLPHQSAQEAGSDGCVPPAPKSDDVARLPSSTPRTTLPHQPAQEVDSDCCEPPHWRAVTRCAFPSRHPDGSPLPIRRPHVLLQATPRYCLYRVEVTKSVVD